jgi:hypothetical protein
MRIGKEVHLIKLEKKSHGFILFLLSESKTFSLPLILSLQEFHRQVAQSLIRILTI